MEDVSAIGFVAFFVWMVAMGVSLLRPPCGRAAEAVAAGTDDTVTA